MNMDNLGLNTLRTFKFFNALELSNLINKNSFNASDYKLLTIEKMEIELAIAKLSAPKFDNCDLSDCF